MLGRFSQAECWLSVFACVAPFVSNSCNRATGCAIDCQDTSCGTCPDDQESQCLNEVRRTQCQTFFQQSSCVTPAFFGAGAFCNPLVYGGNYGAWLEAVGSRYCGN